MPIKIIKKASVAPPDPLVERQVKAPKVGRPYLDGMCEAAIAMAPQSIVPWVLMASYAYYIHDQSLISDGLYDKLMRRLKETWADVSHPQKVLITEGDLEAGSLFALDERKYPTRTRAAARFMMRTEWGVEIDIREEVK